MISYRFINLIIFLILSTFSSAQLSFEELPAQNQLRLTYGEAELLLGNSTYGFSVNNVKHLGQGTDFGKSPESGANGKLWYLIMTDDMGVSSFVNLTNTTSCDKSYSFDPVNGLVLHFNNLDVPREYNSIDVTVTIKASDIPNMFAFRIDVDNRCTGYAIWEIRFPEIYFGDIDNDGVNSIVANPAAEGRFIADPTRHDWNGWTLAYGLPYPDSRSQMQWSAYFKGYATNYYPAPTKTAGIYLATHDEYPVAAKNFSYNPDSLYDRWFYACTLYPEDIENGLDYTMTYDHIVGVYEGYWYEAAKIYRDWASGQHWVRKGKLAERTDLPQWFKDITYCHRLQTDGYSYSEAYYRALDLNGRLTGPMLIQWYLWEDPPYEDPNASGNYPPTSIAQRGLDTTIAALKANDIYSTLYVDPYVWWTGLESFAAEGEPYACKNPDGSVKMWSSTEWALMDVGTPFWIDYCKTVVREIVEKYNPPGIYLDQSGGMMSVTYDKSHGNPVGHCEDRVARERAFLEALINEARSMQPDVLFWGEGNSEFAMDLIDAKLIHYNLYKNYLPLFPAVYHEYYPGYGRVQDLIEDPADPFEAEMQAGWVWNMGYQIGRIWSWYLKYGNHEQQEMLTYIEKLNVLRSQAKEYLVYGQMQRPPYIDPYAVPEMTAYLSKGGPAVLPGILASVWRSPDGSVGMAVTNMTGSSQTFNVTLDMDEYNVSQSSGYELREYGTGNLIASDTNRMFAFSLTLDSLDANVYEVSVSCIGQFESDLNDDCRVDLLDFAMIVQSWLECTDPSDENCQNIQQ
jgi:hypothetical protein